MERAGKFKLVDTIPICVLKIAEGIAANAGDALGELQGAHDLAGGSGLEIPHIAVAVDVGAVGAHIFLARGVIQEDPVSQPDVHDLQPVQPVPALVAFRDLLPEFPVLVQTGRPVACVLKDARSHVRGRAAQEDQPVILCPVQGGEGGVVNSLNIGRYNNGPQGNAAEAGLGSDRGQAVRHAERMERGIAAEGLGADGGDAFRDSDLPDLVPLLVPGRTERDKVEHGTGALNAENTALEAPAQILACLICDGELLGNNLQGASVPGAAALIPEGFPAFTDPDPQVVRAAQEDIHTHKFGRRPQGGELFQGSAVEEDPVLQLLHAVRQGDLRNGAA